MKLPELPASRVVQLQGTYPPAAFNGWAVLDPFWQDVVLLVTGDSGFADLSLLRNSPAIVGTPASVSAPDATWLSSKVLNFQTAASAVQYSKAGGFLNSDTQDFTIEAYVAVDLLAYDFAYSDGWKEWVRCTMAGAESAGFSIYDSTGKSMIIDPAAYYFSETILVRKHVALVRKSMVLSHYVNGTRQMAPHASSNYNFDVVSWGNLRLNTGAGRQASGVSEYLRITKQARYQGATYAPPISF